MKTQDMLILVGTYTSGSSEGIYVYRFDIDNLTATLLNKAEIDNPSYLTVSGDSKFVYSVSESGKENSKVNAFDFYKTTGQIQLLNSSTVGADPCYIRVDAQNRFVVTADYSGGSVSVTPIATDGSLMLCEETYRFDGSGPDSVRQAHSHIHCIAASPDGRSFFSTDLGNDCIYQFNVPPDRTVGYSPFFDYDESKTTKLTPGSGPRHLLFNAAGTMAYLINELSGKVTVFKYTDAPSGGKLSEVQSLVADTCNARGSADIHLSPDERFLYASTRLKGDGIVIFKVDKQGLLAKIGYQPTGRHPRNFAITPDGMLMLVACKDDGMIQIFSIDQETGLLSDTGKNIPVDQAVCIRLVTAK
ncbi:MAG: lactonase family protein [Candidatus Symbiothrix sp.]|nr:lactonase family protein [Candidatus Symbiothrix sp.]